MKNCAARSRTAKTSRDCLRSRPRRIASRCWIRKRVRRCAQKWRSDALPLVSYEDILSELRSFTYAELVNECRQLGLTVDPTRFAIARNAYSLTDGSESLTPNQRHGLSVVRAYVVFCRMRNPQLESGLDGIADNSPLRPLKKILLKGN